MAKPERAPIRFIAIGLAALAASCAPRGVAPVAPAAPVATAGPVLHLVVDAGSSGTRFCVFRVDVTDQGCASPEPVGDCLKTTDGRGLHTYSPAEAKTLFATQLTALRQRGAIAGAVVLGTGGFRDAAGQIDRGRPGMEALWAAVRAELAAHGIPAVARPIEGQEEGRLGWLSVARNLQPSSGFSTIEIGGATCQLATAPNPKAGFAEVRAVSDLIGLNATWTRFASRKDVFAPCSSGDPESTKGQDAEACATLIGKEVFAPSRLFATPLASDERQRPVYVLGAPWTGVFDRFVARLHPAQKDQVTLGELEGLAQKYCRLKASEITTEAKTYEPARTCFTLAYEVAFLRATLGTDDPAGKAINGQESWPRGASATGLTGKTDLTDPSKPESLFADCH